MSTSSDVAFSLFVVLGVLLRAGYFVLLLALAFWVLERMGVIVVVRESAPEHDTRR